MSDKADLKGPKKRLQCRIRTMAKTHSQSMCYFRAEFPLGTRLESKRCIPIPGSCSCCHTAEFTMMLSHH